MDTNLNAVNEQQLQVKEISDSHSIDFTETVALVGDAEVKQENMTVLKKEPDDVCCVRCPIPIFISLQQKQFVQ